MKRPKTLMEVFAEDVMIDPAAITEAIREAHARRCAISLWHDHLGYWTAPYVEGDECRSGWLMVATIEDSLESGWTAAPTYPAGPPGVRDRRAAALAEGGVTNTRRTNMVCERTAARLTNTIGREAGYTVRVSVSTQPRRRWYSIGNMHNGRWHQCCGFALPEHVTAWLREAIANRARTA